MEHYNIIIEANIPFARGIFDRYANVRYLPANEITPGVMRDTDALMTRTRTRCDATLLGGSRCREIASATIGLDHVDTPWCENHGIHIDNAPGCNAPAVAQYVMAAAISAYGTDLRGITIGIIGVGNVGKVVKAWAESLGMRVLACDPPRARMEGGEGFCTLEQIEREADIVTIHTPLTRDADYPTFHLMDERFFNALERSPMIINSARGAVVDTPALLAAIKSGKVRHAVIDCWEGEPDINRELLDLCYIATPHIAGYSRQGKIRATAMAAQALARALALPDPELEVEVPAPAPEKVTPEQITDTYDPMADTAALLRDPSQFEYLRNNYHLREEPL